MAATVRIEAQWQAVYQKPPPTPGRSRRSLPPASEMPNRSRWSRHPSSRSGPAPPGPDSQGMPRPVLMQHHARQRPARSCAPVCATPRRAFQQPFGLQGDLGPGVAPPEPMVNQVLVEMPRRSCRSACDIGARPRLPDPPGTRLPEARPSRRSNSPASPPSSNLQHQRRNVRSLIPSSSAASS